MDNQIKSIMASIRDEFSVDAIYIFGSHGRGDDSPESDVDVLVVSSEGFRDPFELSYEIRRFLHTKLDRALDVIVSSKEQFNERRDQPWTVEHVAYTEGVAV